MHDNLKQKDIYLFSWENVPGNESNRLLNFLQDYHQINWVENAKIIKDEDKKIIRVFSDKYSIEIMLFNESAQINLGNGGSANLVVKEENGTHNFYDIGQKYQNKYNISPVYYAAYNLSIKNNGSTPVDFRLARLHLQDGDKIFNSTTLKPYGENLLTVLHDLERENKIRQNVSKLNLETKLKPQIQPKTGSYFHKNSFFHIVPKDRTHFSLTSPKYCLIYPKQIKFGIKLIQDSDFPSI